MHVLFRYHDDQDLRRGDVRPLDHVPRKGELVFITIERPRRVLEVIWNLSGNVEGPACTVYLGGPVAEDPPR